MFIVENSAESNFSHFQVVLAKNIRWEYISHYIFSISINYWLDV